MSRDPSCVFCRIVEGIIPCFKVYEDEATIAFLDINPVNPGHAPIITKNHAEKLDGVIRRRLGGGSSGREACSPGYFGGNQPRRHQSPSGEWCGIGAISLPFPFACG